MPTKLQVMEYTLEAMDIPSDKAQNLADAGATTPKKIIRLPTAVLDQLLNDNEINQGDYADLLLFRAYLLDSVAAEDVIPGSTDLDAWKDFFTDDKFMDWVQVYNRTTEQDQDDARNQDTEDQEQVDETENQEAGGDEPAEDIQIDTETKDPPQATTSKTKQMVKQGLVE